MAPAGAIFTGFVQDPPLLELATKLIPFEAQTMYTLFPFADIMGYCPPFPTFTAGFQVAPSLVLALKNIPPLLSVHVTYTLFPTLCTLGLKPAPKLAGEPNVGVAPWSTKMNEDKTSTVKRATD